MVDLTFNTGQYIACLILMFLGVVSAGFSKTVVLPLMMEAFQKNTKLKAYAKEDGLLINTCSMVLAMIACVGFYIFTVSEGVNI